MSINGLNVTSPVSARYWSELKDLSDTEKIELIALLSSSMTTANECYITGHNCSIFFLVHPNSPKLQITDYSFKMGKRMIGRRKGV